MACRGLDEARPRRGRKARIKTAALTSRLQLVRVSRLDPGGGDSPPFGQEVLSWGGRGRVEGGAGLQHGAGDVEEAIGH